MRTNRPRPLTGTPPAEPPPVDTIDGRPVTWLAWSPSGYPSKRITPCGQCGYKGAQWITWGRVDPASGEEFTDIRARAKSVWEVKVPAWPILRLEAHQCPDCYHRRIFDDKAAGGRTEVPLTSQCEQLDLLPDLSIQRKATRR